MFVDDAPRRGFERSRQRRRCLRYVVVDDTSESIRAVPCDDGLKKEEQLVLALCEMANRWRQARSVFRLLPPLIWEQAQVDEFLNALEDVLA